jgi:hypothetical protein
MANQIADAPYLYGVSLAEDRAAGHYFHAIAAPFTQVYAFAAHQLEVPAPPGISRAPNKVFRGSHGGNPSGELLSGERIRPLVANDLPRGLDNNFNVDANIFMTPAFVRRGFILGADVPDFGPIDSGNLSVTRNAFGLTRLTLTIPENYWDYMVISLTDPDTVARDIETRNPEKIAALLVCVLANGFDPRRPPLQFDLSQNNDQYHGLPRQTTVNLPGPWSRVPPAGMMINGRTVGTQFEVPFLNSIGRWPNMGDENQWLSFLAMLNDTDYLRDIQVIAKLLPIALRRPAIAEIPAATRGNEELIATLEANNEYIRNNPGAYVQNEIRRGVFQGSAHQKSTIGAIPINQRWRADTFVNHNPFVPVHTFVPIRQNHSKYLAHLYHAVLQSILRVRETQSGTPDDLRYMTVGRIVLYFIDMRSVHGGQEQFARGQYSTGRTLAWGEKYVGCNNGKHVLKQIISNVTIWNPPSASSSHNCLFACLRHARKVHQKDNFTTSGVSNPWFEKQDVLFAADENAKREVNIVRSLLGLRAGEPINMRDVAVVAKVAEFMKVSIRLVNMKFDPLLEVETPGNVCIPLFFIKREPRSLSGYIYIGKSL